jgi:hypothetical protein
MAKKVTRIQTVLPVPVKHRIHPTAPIDLAQPEASVTNPSHRDTA